MLALLLAVIRSLPGPVFFPLRVLAIVYADFFRGVPTILVITLLGFGAPALAVSGVPTSTTFWGIVALVLVYTAYVSEVYRAGIESVHPSQAAAARSLGLTHGQSLRYVVLPQAVRRVIPPLLNDFIGLQKDTALVGVLGSIEAFKQTQIDQAATFNFTSGLAAAVLFVAVTIPLARFTDWLVGRDRRRQLAGGHGRERARAGGGPQVVREERGAEGHRPHGRRARGRLPDRCIRFREVDPAAVRQPARADRRGADRRPRRGRHVVGRGREPDPARHRDRLPGVQSLPAHERARERDPGAAQGASPLPGAGRGGGDGAARPLRARRQGATTTRTGCREDSSSASRSCARSR